MKTQLKVVYFLGEFILIVALSLVDACKYYQMVSIVPYATFSTLIILIIWVIANLLFKIHNYKSFSKAIFYKTIMVWSITTVIDRIINYEILSLLFDNTVSKLSFSIINTLIFWLSGLLILLSWHFIFLFLYYVYSLDKSSLLRKCTTTVGGLLCASVLFILFVNFYIDQSYENSIQSINDISESQVAIVFGAGVYESKYPSAILSDRIETAADLYSSSKVEKIILSGDGNADNNDIAVMVQKAIESGIPENAIIIDNFGNRTFETCVHAREIYGVTQAILVTQQFHLPRALFLCNNLGIKSNGVSADRSNYYPLAIIKWQIREFLATAYGWVEIQFYKL